MTGKAATSFEPRASSKHRGELDTKAHLITNRSSKLLWPSEAKALISIVYWPGRHG